MNILKTDRLQKSYKSRHVVKGVSVDVQSGEVVGLLGPNGAGKTTLFYMIVGLIRQDAGDITFNEKKISNHAMHARARMGISYLPQEASIFRKLTVKQNILSILELRKDLNKKSREEKLSLLMEEFHISHLADDVGFSLSGGERRRAEIARALATDPKFILLDEPFAGIDPISVIDIKHIITHLRDNNIGILITDHNVRETLDICERAYILSEGEVICAGNAEIILKDKRVRAVYLGDNFEL